MSQGGSSELPEDTSMAATAGAVAGVASILGSLANVGVSIYAAREQAKMQEKLMKAEQAAAAATPLPAQIMYAPAPAATSSTLPIILGVIGVVVVIGAVLMLRGGSSPAPYGGYYPPMPTPVGAPATVGVPPAPASFAPPPMPQVRRIRRIKKKKPKKKVR